MAAVFFFTLMSLNNMRCYLRNVLCGDVVAHPEAHFLKMIVYGSSLLPLAVLQHIFD